MRADCDTLPVNHVAEWFFEAVSTSLLPTKLATITGKDDVRGELLTFSFHVHTEEEIKCYIIWNGQTMRFFGDHISKVLRCIFKQSQRNDEYLGGQEIKKMEQKLEELIPDKKFKAFCNQYSR